MVGVFRNIRTQNVIIAQTLEELKRNNSVVDGTLGSVSSTSKLYVYKADIQDWVPVQTGGAGSIFVTNVTSSGNTIKVMNDPPNQASVKQVSTNDYNMRVYIEWDRGSSEYQGSPTVNGFPVVQTGKSGPTYTGYADISGTYTNILAIFDGTTYTVPVIADAGPNILTAVFSGTYPGSQTELKAGDQFQVTITTDKNADMIEFQNYAALAYSQHTVSAGQSFNVNATIGFVGTTATALGGRVRARTPSGSWGPWFDITNTVICNNLYPTVTTMNQASITYPSGQQAIKNSESVSITSACSNFDTIVYSSPNGELSIPNPTTYEATKAGVTRIGGSYNISTANYQISATRAANGATTTKSVVVYIANVGCTLTVTEPASRLRSGGNDGTSPQDYTITITANQNLLNAPTLVAPMGTWQGTGFSGSGTTWTRTLRIHDNDTKGSYTWGTISATNLAGIPTNTISGDNTYTIGGFVTRTIILPAFANEVNMNVAATDYSKVTMSWSFKSLPNKRPVGTTAVPDADSWCLHTLNTNPTIIRILDTSAAAASSQASTITISESV